MLALCLMHYTIHINRMIYAKDSYRYAHHVWVQAYSDNSHLSHQMLAI